jgi:hypothetical protein
MTPAAAINLLGVSGSRHRRLEHGLFLGLDIFMLAKLCGGATLSPTSLLFYRVQASPGRSQRHN